MDMDKLLALLGLGAGGLLTGFGINDLRTIGEAAGTAATDVATELTEMSQFKPFTVTSTTGGTFGVGQGPEGQTQVTMALSPEEKAFQQAMFGGAGKMFSQAMQPLSYGTPGATAMAMGQQALGKTPYGLGGIQGAAGEAFGLGSQFMTQAGVDTAQREADIYGRIRAAQSPEEERQRLALEERLFAQGRGGVTTSQYGGTPEQLAMAKAQSEAQNTAMLQAMQQAQAEQAQQAGLGAQFAGLGAGLAGQGQGLQAAQQQQALQALQAGQGLNLAEQQQAMARQMQQAQLGGQFLGQSYMPQSQLLNVQQASQLYPQLQQQAQLYGAGQYGETMLSGIEAQLLAEQARANLIGGLGSSLLGGLFTPVAQQGGGATNILMDLLGIG